MLSPFFRLFCRYVTYGAFRIRDGSTGVRNELQKLPGSDGVHFSDHKLELCESEGICGNAASDSSLQKRVFAQVTADSPDAAFEGGIFFLRPAAAILLFIVIIIVTVSAASAQDSTGVPGVFAGTSVTVVEQMGDPVLRQGELAECILSADGRFRFAALRPGGGLLWTRGSWSVTQCDAEGTDVAFRSDDISGTINGRREGNELFLKFSPRPMETLAFRMNLRAPVPAAGDGWPEHVDKPALIGNSAGIYLGTLFASKRAGRNAAGEIGSALLVLGSEGDMAGGVLAPAPGDADSSVILCPTGGEWRLDGKRLLMKPAWGRPSPPRAWRNMSVQAVMDARGTVLEGQTSLEGIPADGCRLEKLAHWPGNADVQAGRVVLSRIGAVIQANGGTSGTAGLFPMRVSADRRLLYIRASDDPQTWLPFPMTVDANGAIRVNDDGKCGYLVRRDNGGADAFVVKTPSISASGAAFPSKGIGPLWLLTLDFHRRPLGSKSSDAAQFQRVIAAALAAPEDAVEEP